MTIRSLTRAQFDEFEPVRHPMVAHFATEKAWYADDEGNVIATLLFDKTDHDWAVVILGRDEQGSFRCIEANSSIEDRDEAEGQLLSRLRSISASCQTVFPQED